MHFWWFWLLKLCWLLNHIAYRKCLVCECHEDLMELCEILDVRFSSSWLTVHGKFNLRHVLLHSLRCSPYQPDLPTCYPSLTFPTIAFSSQWMPLLKFNHQVAFSEGILWYMLCQQVGLVSNFQERMWIQKTDLLPIFICSQWQLFQDS